MTESTTTGSVTDREIDDRPLKKQRRGSDDMLPKPESGNSSEDVNDATTEAEGGDIEDQKKDKESSEENVEEKEESEEERGRSRGRQTSTSRPKSREHSHSKSRSRSHKGEEHERRTVIKMVQGKEVRQHISRDRYHSRSVSNNQQTKSSTDRLGNTSTTKGGSHRKDEQSHSRERVRVSISPDGRSGDTLEYERDSNGGFVTSDDCEADITPEDVENGKTVDQTSYGYKRCEEREASRSRSRSREGSRDRERNRSRERTRGYEESVDINGKGGKRRDNARSREREDSTSTTTVSAWSEDSSGNRISTSRTKVEHHSGDAKNDSEQRDKEQEEGSYSVIATNIPSSATHAHVREIFERIGAVRNVDSLELSYRFRRRVNQYERSDQGAENNFMITYYNRDDASEAVYRLNGSQIDHEVITVTLYDSEKRADFKQYPEEGKGRKSRRESYDSGWVEHSSEGGEGRPERGRSYSRDERRRSYSRGGTYSRDGSYSRERSYSRSRSYSRGRSYSRSRSYSRDGRDRKRSYSRERSGDNRRDEGAEKEGGRRRNYRSRSRSGSPRDSRSPERNT
ncbi:hypothetical protein CKK34_1957 [Yarrowia sp. E02]|nr:hypothetical protein CKK34_1957 [Yarrowia sp. E02]